MKKKILSLFIALITALSVTSMFAACGHEHTFSSEWSKDKVNHWHAATCEHTDEVSEKAAHTFKDGKCSVCGYVAPHEHTYAEAWTNDETYHWHAATCEHKTEVSAKAEHTLTDGKCTVCGYEEAAKCTCAEPCIICPDCGGCIDFNCKNTECIKCGDGLKSNLFEAENAILKDGETDVYFNVTNKNIPLEFEQVTYVQGVMGNAGGTFTFKINSSKAGVATLRVRNGKNFTKSVFTDNMIVMVNGEIIERDTVVNAFDNECPKPAEGPNYHSKRDFDWTNLGCINLVEGENIIVFTVVSPDSELGYNMDKIDIATSEDTTLTWTPTDNSDKVEK